LCRALGSSHDQSDAESLRREIWQILRFVLARYLRYHASRLGQVSPDDIEDIVSQKALELAGNIDMSIGRLRDLDAAEIPGFLSTVARNGLVDTLKANRRWAQSPDDGDTEPDRWSERPRPPAESPDVRVEGNEFASALRKCAEALAPRARLVWFFRVFYDMPPAEEPRRGTRLHGEAGI
jgi:DNA-directed RNA polymerase specialized sigma24 family protein